MTKTGPPLGEELDKIKHKGITWGRWFRGWIVWYPQYGSGETFHKTLKEAVEVRDAAAIRSHGSVGDFIAAPWR